MSGKADWGSAPSMRPPRVTAIVLNWNGLADTRACLASLRAQDYKTLSLIVVDNASSDGSAAALRAEFADLTLRCNGKNLGYTGGNNPAIGAALADGADYVWLFNNDAAAAPDVLGRLVAAAEADPRIGLISPLIGHAGGGCEFAGGLIDVARGTWRTTADPAQGRAWQERHPDRFVPTGTALLLRRGLVERIGLLDDRFFAYWEDTDYGLRSLAAGFRNHLAFDVLAGHAPKPPPSAGLGRPHYYYLMARNEILFWRKHLGKRAARPVFWALRRQMRLAAASRHNRATVDSIMAGIWDGLLNRGGAYDPTRRMPAPARALLAVLPVS